LDIIETILNRRSIRNFKADPVSRETITKLIEVARWSPSGSNTQPWEFMVLGGSVLEEVKKRIGEAAKSGGAGDHPDIPYPPMPEPFAGRQKAVGKAMQAYLVPDVSGKNKPDPRTSAQNFFGAPVGIIVCVEKEISPRAFLGLGMVAQTLCLAALNLGLGTCIMSMMTYRPEVYRQMFGVPDTKIIAFGIALGYPDFNARVNNFPRTREPLDKFVTWHGI
jgi:nitroreductase